MPRLTTNEPAEVEPHSPEYAEPKKLEGEQVSGTPRPQSEESKRIHKAAAQAFPSRERIEKRRTTEVSNRFLENWQYKLLSVGAVGGQALMSGLHVSQGNVVPAVAFGVSAGIFAATSMTRMLGKD